MSTIPQALTRLFQKHRIVFWYDAKRELRQEYEPLHLPGVEKIELKNNPFGVKYRILRQKPKQKFLLYHEGPQPPDLENWLLDVQLAYGEFKADQVSLWLSEIGLGPEYWDVVQDHERFYRAASRRTSLKARLEPNDTQSAIRMKMLAVCVGGDAEHRLESILLALLDELASEDDQKIHLIRDCALDEFLWQQVERKFAYTSPAPGVRDFTIELFKSCYSLRLDESAALNAEALIFIDHWKDSVRYRSSFETLSNQCGELLNIESDLQQRQMHELVEIDYFSIIDQKILSDLVNQISERTISNADCEGIIRRRRTTHWYATYEHIYEAVSCASEFIAALDQVDLSVSSLTDGVRKYTTTWYRLDAIYRKFIYHSRQSQQISLLGVLIDQIENLYSNNFLLKVNDNWQGALDEVKKWDAAPTQSQVDFFEFYVNGYLIKNNKVAVIISDALRYEIGHQLLERIQSEDRYTAEMEALLTMLPSYTQLGMAALLPNQVISLKDNGTVLVDDLPAAGTENRAKILAQRVSGGAGAIRAKQLLTMSRDESRALVRDNQVLYIYHNHIDAIGDDLATEEKVFVAAEDAIQEIINLVKKLANANLSNMLITSDHGFIYQDRPLDESEFAAVDVTGKEMVYRQRRFVLGRGLKPQPGVMVFKSGELGLGGDLEIAIPKSINRLRLKGSGSRYVHGGAALQEVIVPVIRINKKRSSDIRQVEVDIIAGQSSYITTGQLSVSFYQQERVSPKIKERRLRVGIYTREGILISDRHDLIFDFTSEHEREREMQVRFVLSGEADQYNNQDVFLRLEERVPDTTHYTEYKSVRYTLRKSFTTDFDF